MKKNRKKDEFLEQLKKIPIIQVVCEKINLSRNTVYRWRKEDEKFAKEMDESLVEGETLVNEMSESQLISMIRDKNWPAISFWLRHRNPKFRDRVEITANIKSIDKPMTPEQEAISREALRLASFTGEIKEVEINKEIKNQDEQLNTSIGTGGTDNQG